MISDWFLENYKVLNGDKCLFLALGFDESLPDFSFNDTAMN